MKYLAIEFTNRYTNQFRDYRSIYDNKMIIDKAPYYNSYYSEEFNEIPLWMIYLNGIVDNELIIHKCNNVDDTINYIIKEEPDYIFFSELEVTSDAIKFIIKATSYLNSIRFIVGRSTTNYDSDKVTIVTSLDKLNTKFNFNRKINLVLPDEFKNYKMARINFTSNCNFNCSFCTNSTGVQDINIDDVLDLFKLFFDKPYIYIGDLTFGQSIEHELSCLRYRRTSRFIVQTNAKTVLSNIHNLHRWVENNIKFVELGVETFNTDTLENYRKPSTIKDNIEAIRILNSLGMKVIPNIMINIKGETKKHFNNTLSYLSDLIEQDLIYYINLYFFTDYDSKIKSDRSELKLIKSWNTTSTEKLAVELFANNLYSMNYELLSNIR